MSEGSGQESQQLVWGSNNKTLRKEFKNKEQKPWLPVYFLPTGVSDAGLTAWGGGTCGSGGRGRVTSEMIPGNYPLLQMEKLSLREEGSQCSWGEVVFLLQEQEEDTMSENTEVWEDHDSRPEVCLMEQIPAGKSQRWWEEAEWLELKEHGGGTHTHYSSATTHWTEHFLELHL